MNRASVMMAGIMAAVLISGGIALGADVPVAVRIQTLTGLSRPIKLTADNYGNIYIGESGASHVVQFTADGADRIAYQTKGVPTALRAMPDGRLYVGRKGGVDIYERGSLVGSVGGISVPVAIGLLSSGDLYVLDAGEYCVKVFDSQANLVRRIGSLQTFGQDLRDLVLDEANGEFYVLGRGQRESGQSSAEAYFWRVQVFSLAGQVLRSFSNFGYGTEGALLSVTSMALDGQRRLYLADNVQNIIGIYGHEGGYLGTLYDLAAPYYNPVSLDYQNDRLYFASFLGKDVTVLGLDGYAVLKISPRERSLVLQGQKLSGAREINISNSGPGELQWSASSTEGWLGLEPSAGRLATGQQQQAEVTIKTDNLTPGTYRETIVINSNAGQTDITVQITVFDPAVLRVTPLEISGETREGEDGGTRTIQVSLTNDLSGTLTWQAETDSSWLMIRPVSGPSNATTRADVFILNSVLSAGTYRGTIRVSAEGATGSPSEVVITHTVLPSNRIRVMTNNEAATFRVSGPMTYVGSGTTWEVEGVPDGVYHITYGDIEGCRTPADEEAGVNGGGNLQFSGEYRKIVRRSIITSMGRSVDSTVVRIFDTRGTLLRQFMAFGRMTGGLDIAAGDTDGDGIEELIAGIAYRDDRVGIIDPDGKTLFEFSAFSGKSGARVSSGDLDGDGRDEIIVLKGKGTPDIRLFKRAEQIEDTGVFFQSSPHGGPVHIAAGDLDGDGREEIAVVQDNLPVLVRTWKIDTAAGPGNWVAVADMDMTIQGDDDPVIGITAVDMYGDGTCELLIGKKSGRIVSIGKDGSIREVYSGENDGVDDLDASDLDGDGRVEFVKVMKDGHVQEFSAEGVIQEGFIAFGRRTTGLRVSTGALGY